MNNAMELPETFQIGGHSYGYSSSLDGVGFKTKFNSPIFSLSVGREQRKFYAHEIVLAKSSVLGRRCSAAFRRSGIRLVDLPKDDPEVFRHLLDYLYEDVYITSGRIVEEDEEAQINEEATTNEEAKLLAKIFVTAHRYDLNNLADLTVSYFEDVDILPCLSEESFLSISKYVYDNSPEGEFAYRELFVETACTWLQDRTKNLDDYVEPYIRAGGEFTYAIYLAQISIEKTIVYRATDNPRKRRTTESPRKRRTTENPRKRKRSSNGDDRAPKRVRR